MADNIAYIHSNKLAKYLREYIGRDGTVYVGQKDGRLARKRITEEDVESMLNSAVNAITPSTPISSSTTPSIDNMLDPFLLMGG